MATDKLQYENKQCEHHRNSLLQDVDAECFPQLHLCPNWSDTKIQIHL